CRERRDQHVVGEIPGRVDRPPERDQQCERQQDLHAAEGALEADPGRWGRPQPHGGCRRGREAHSGAPSATRSALAREAPRSARTWRNTSSVMACISGSAVNDSQSRPPFCRRSTLSCILMWPGRRVITSTRSPRNTASSTLWVMKNTVLSVAA